MSDETTQTIPEFAAACRERCGRPAQLDGRRCGDKVEGDGDPSWTFCGYHMLAALVGGN